MKKVSFEENKSFNKSNVEKFINFHKKVKKLADYLRTIWRLFILKNII